MSDGAAAVIADLVLWRGRLEALRTTVVMHPEDVTDAVRAEVARYPLATLEESTFVTRGQALFVDHSKLAPSWAGFGDATAAQIGMQELER